MTHKLLITAELFVFFAIIKTLQAIRSSANNLISIQAKNEKKIADVRQFATSTLFRTPHKAFTLLELLVVIAIIGLLSTIVVISMTTARSRGRDVTRIADAKQITTALEQYYSDNYNYPGAVATGAALGSKSGKTDCLTSTVTCTCLSNSGFSNACGTTLYMSNIPTYPGTVSGACTSDGTFGTPTTPFIGQICYFADATSAAANYKIMFKLENTYSGGTNCIFSNISGLVCT
jgi:prepilin-type N-terminal cleavage/methylation domain-containing protein